MSDLPHGWEWATFGEIAETSLGKMLDRGRETGTNQVPYLRNVNVQWGRLDLSSVFTMDIPPEQLSTYEVKSGDLLVCEGGEIGRCAVWPGSATYMAFQKALHRVRPHTGISARFLRYFLEWQSVSGQLIPYATGSTIKHLPQQQLRRIRVPVPTQNEQRRIVAALEDHISRLDVGRSNLATAMRKIGAARDAALASAVATCPRDSWSRLGSVALDARYGTSLKCSYDGPGRPVLRIPNVQSGRIDLSDIKYTVTDSPDLTRLAIQKDDLLIIRTNGTKGLIGRSAVAQKDFDCSFASYLIRIRLDRSQLLPGWAQICLQSPPVRRQIEELAASSAGQ
ncbi:restriction endonuclease subunit S [Pseudonocardia nigra]|uniref:restriction endonuclease subunit S n=1 Tax=Pseudonocardia nigra TaxID=1921578 RepID=UPI001C5F1E30|nr:restriction endonuclease subunit S [Pseudonocardia nigra]